MMSTTTGDNAEVPPTTVMKALHIDHTAISTDHSSSSSSSSSSPTPLPINRNWLTNLISHHSTDPRLTPHTTHLHTLYPTLSNKALAVAPMVDQSDLPFRHLCRRYNANLCFTPMIHAKMFWEKGGYRKKFWDEVNGISEEDRPLIVQLCGSHLESLLFTMRFILKHKGSGIDGFDLNCGCPQTIAKRGEYGAYLLEKENGNTVVNVAKTLVRELGHLIPISVKVRLLPSGLSDSLILYKRLIEDAGVAMLTIHGRTRLQKGLRTGRADWDAIRTIVSTFGHLLPIIANGSIGNFDDVRECLEVTGADGIMSSEAVLEYPAVFTETGTKAVGGKRVGVGRLSLAREYLGLCGRFPPEVGGQGTGIKCVKAHLHRMLHQDLKEMEELRNTIAYAKEYCVLEKACDDIQQKQEREGHVVEDEHLTWYMRHRVETDDGIPFSSARILMDRTVPFAELDDEAAGCFTNLFGDDDGGCY